MYTIHQNPAFILDTMDTGEKNRFFWIFTRDFGLINASAQGVRSITSKLNPHLQQYSFSTIEFVRGKDIWRLTNALVFSSESFVFSHMTKNGKEAVARIANLLRRLHAGEEAHTDLFDEIYEAYIRIAKSYDQETIEAIELLVTIKILYRLGYWEEYKETYSLHNSSFTRESLDRTYQKKHELQERIKQSLRESHL